MKRAKRKECLKKVKTLLPEDLQTRILDFVYEDKALSYSQNKMLISLPDGRQRMLAFTPHMERSIELGIVRKIIIDTYNYNEWSEFPQIIKTIISSTEQYERILEFEIISIFVEPDQYLVHLAYQIWCLTRQQTRGRPIMKEFFGYFWDHEQTKNLSELLIVYEKRHNYHFLSNRCILVYNEDKLAKIDAGDNNNLNFQWGPQTEKLLSDIHPGYSYSPDTLSIQSN
ncbi:hypothetical protein AXF42_Ash003650 [Apostasia shenzhenica]|uniref:Uncharacterized protein n=1 Tax=Apostasia shenzhenica TaxID=1088818 RepID=A0A2I0AHI0_9ASPA|nr:hypothetical protein AXF42_Ash003650 [Apostasia shenzhenica]